jgi:hypothetical protein
MKQRIQIIMIVAILVAGIRLGLILYERHEAGIAPAKKESAPLNPDYYVTPKKLYPYDLKSAKQLTQQPAWVKVGYYYPYYSYDPATRHADLSHEAGTLLPLQKLDIKDVIAAASPKTPGGQQILAVFEQQSKRYATPVGIVKNGDYKFNVNDMLFIENPHQLYKHWPADVWQSIDQHQVKPGMNELQADFAVGIGLLESGSDSYSRTLDYPNGGKPLTINFENGKAVEIRQGQTGQ